MHLLKSARNVFLIPVILFGFANFGWAQDTYTLSGYIKDALTGEVLIGATVFIEETKAGTASNSYGFYSLSTTSQTYTLSIGYLGYETLTQTIDLSLDLRIDFELTVLKQELEEVVITGEREDLNITSIEMSTFNLPMKTIQKMPAFLGEVDLLGSIKLLPGVSTVGEGTRGFNVRGGGIDQNLVLLDEAPVYNSAHLFGFFSVFNPDAIRDVKLIKGGIPAQYGGRLSSLLDVRMKEGNTKRISGSGGIGTIFSRFTLEGPIKKEKASFVVAGRRSYIDLLAKPFLNDDFDNSIFNFWDLTLKTNLVLNDKNRIFLSGYLGRDKFQFGDDAAFSWGNATGTLRWNHLYSNKLFGNLTFIYSNYDYELGFGSDQDTFDWTSKIINYSIKPEFFYYPNTKNSITFGAQAILYDFEPAQTQGQSAGEFQEIDLDNKYALEASLYIGNEQTLNSRLSLDYGLRFSLFDFMGPGTAYEFDNPEPGERRRPVSSEDFSRWETIETYNTWEPRFSLRYQLNQKSSIKASYNRMAQYIHLISNTTASTPLDVWTPSTNNIEPQRAHQVALGYFRNFEQNLFEASVEVYYKDLDNQIDYIDGADLLINEFLEGELLSGSGRAYGAEFYVRKTRGKLTGWVSYTLARSERKVDGINRGRWYPTRFDQAHSLNLIGFYELNRRWTFSANFTFSSGTPANFPSKRFEWQNRVVSHNPNLSRNNLRIPSAHRIDVSATLKGKNKKNHRWKGYWVFSVYNIYNRRNPFSIFFRQQENRPPPSTPVNTEAVQFSLIGSIIPAVSYNFNF